MIKHSLMVFIDLLVDGVTHHNPEDDTARPMEPDPRWTFDGRGRMWVGVLKVTHFVLRKTR